MGVKNISIVTLGCSKNEIDSELMMGILKKQLYYYQFIRTTDIIVINTVVYSRCKRESVKL